MRLAASQCGRACPTVPSQLRIPEAACRRQWLRIATSFTAWYQDGICCLGGGLPPTRSCRSYRSSIDLFCDGFPGWRPMRPYPGLLSSVHYGDKTFLAPEEPHVCRMPEPQTILEVACRRLVACSAASDVVVIALPRVAAEAALPWAILSRPLRGLKVGGTSPPPHAHSSLPVGCPNDRLSLWHHPMAVGC